MRWLLIILLCVAVASARNMKKNRFGRMLQNLVDFEDKVETGLRDAWTDDESDEFYDDEDDQDDDPWREPGRHHVEPRHIKKARQDKECPHCKENRVHLKPTFDDDDSESESREDFDDHTPVKHRKQRRHDRHDDADEPKQTPCRPKYDLIEKLDQINAQIAAKLHREAKMINDDKNIVTSPVAVQLALAALNQGARGSTKRQIGQLLEFGLSKNQYQNAYAALARALRGEGPGQSGSKSVTIKSTTDLVLAHQSAQEQFIESIKTCYGGEVKKCDFRQKNQKCKDQINQWVSTKMGLKSQQVLAEHEITGNTKMVSINTMFLKANWGKQFRKNLKTVEGRFYPLGDKKSTTVKTLQTEGDFNYHEDEQMQILGIQTQEKQLTVYIILPKERHGLSHLEKQRIQYGKQLQELLDECDSKKQTLKVQLPTFQVVYKMDTKQVLRKLGVEDAFDDDEADFSGIASEEEHLLKHGRRQTGGLEDVDVKKAYQKQQQEHLHLNKLIQLATFQIDENGVDAADSHKASKLKKAKSIDEDNDENEDAMERSNGQFRVDHAFAFAVRHSSTNQLLLIGRIVAAQETQGQMHETESD